MFFTSARIGATSFHKVLATACHYKHSRTLFEKKSLTNARKNNRQYYFLLAGGRGKVGRGGETVRTQKK